MSIKLSVSVITLSVHLSKGDIMPAFVFQEDLGVSADAYIYSMDTIMESLMCGISGEGHYIFP